MNRINKLETLVNRYKLAMHGQVDLQKFTSYALTWHSTAIEGSTLTEGQVYNLLDLDIPAKNKPFTEQQMVIDHQKALIFTLNETKERAPLTETLIQQIGALVVKNTGSIYNTALGTFDSTHGEYRLLNVFAGTRRFPDSTKVPTLMKTLVNEINDKTGKVQTFSQKCELAFELHYRFVSIHPFADGNGRTSRLLMNYILATFELPIFYVFKSSRIPYIQALEKARTANNITVFNDFMYRQYQKFLEKDLKTIEK
ncbi:MAG: Fic family protein [Dysgonamonadaceae bacterium]|jgi:Fic family protein|nr:Fic family protein [Dysgonamonadaceae bacterium]